MFQSTFPHGERLSPAYSARISSAFQSTFPHGERRIQVAISVLVIHVSIHVPARGTTQFESHPYPLRKCFNPRSRTGNDGH